LSEALGEDRAQKRAEVTPPIIERPAQAWRVLLREQRTAVLVSIGLFVSMLLPWYGKTDTIVISGKAQATARTLSAFQAFSFVEAAVLLVSAGVLAMLFARGEGREFHLPGGDGTIVAIAGGWASLLIFYRLLDKPGLQGNERITSTVGLQWGIFIALLLALGLLYAGARMRAGERGQPPLARPGAAARESGSRRDPASERAPTEVLDDDLRVESRSEAEEPTPSDAAAPVPARGRSRFPPAPADQMSFEDSPPGEE
jgi:hypothetical protein